MQAKLSKPNSCSGCPLEYIGQGFSDVEGTGAIPLMFVGESLGFHEMLQGLPFRPNAEAGSVLELAFNSLGLFRSQVALWNLIGCRPPQDLLNGMHYEIEAINHCKVHFDKVIQRFKPKVIVALGALPFKHLTGLKGEKLAISDVRGYVFKAANYDCLVVPTYHPSFLRRGQMNLFNLFVMDIQKALLIAKGLLKEDKDFILDPVNNVEYLLNYNTTPDPMGAFKLEEYLRKNPDILISYDIETDTSTKEDEDEREETNQQITQIQFSIRKGTGYAFPHKEPFISIAKQILALPNPKAGHNIILFDNPILEKHGFVINGQLTDTMWLAHHIQPDLPLALQSVASWCQFPFAWKHYASSDLAFYGIADVDSVLWIVEKLTADLKKQGLYGSFSWDAETKKLVASGYVGLRENFRPVLDKISKRGLPIDINRQVEVRNQINDMQKAISDKIQALIPDSLRNIDPVKGYKKIPKEITMLVGSNDAREATVKRERTKDGIKFEEIVRMQLLEFDDIDKVSKDKIKVKRWAVIEPFNPSSSHQAVKLIKHLGHETKAKKFANKIKLDDEGNEKVSSEQIVLKRLAEDTGLEIYKLILEYRELGKIVDAYLSNHWIPKTSTINEYNNIGRVHAEFTTRPATGQLSARKPPIQTIPARGALSKLLRSVIVARPQHKLIKFDKKSFHAQTMAFEAKSANYLRLARSDIHSYVTAHMFRLPDAHKCLSWSDEDLKAFLSDVKKKYSEVRDKQAKQTILGIALGLTEHGCYTRYRENFNPTIIELKEQHKFRKEPSAEKLQELIKAKGFSRVKSLYGLLRELFPEVFKWQQDILNKIAKDKCIISVWGFIRRFYEVNRPVYSQGGRILEFKRGEEANDAISFLVQNDAHGMIQKQILELDLLGYNDRYNLINTVHDDVQYECPVSLVDECLELVPKVLNAPCIELSNELCPNGLAVEVDAKIGVSMDKLEEIKL